MEKNIDEYIQKLLLNEPENHLKNNVERSLSDIEKLSLLKRYLELEHLIQLSANKFDSEKAFENFKKTIQ